MARETAAQRNARYDAEREQRRLEQMAAYPARLMSAFARVNNQYDWQLKVVDNSFEVSNPYSSSYNKKLFLLNYSYDTVSQENLEDLEYMLTDLEERQAEAKRQSEVKAEAQRKVRELLNDEERALLGL